MEISRNGGRTKKLNERLEKRVAGEEEEAVKSGEVGANGSDIGNINA